MVRQIWYVVCALSVGFGFAPVSSHAFDTPDSVKQSLVDTTEAVDSTVYYVIETKHRLFPDFVQIDTVHHGSYFVVGEEEYRASIITFNPHLGITTKGEYLVRSDTLYNPAVRIEVSLEGEVKQQSWAFYYTDAPHFKAEDLLGFRLVDFHVADKYVPVPAPGQN